MAILSDCSYNLNKVSKVTALQPSSIKEKPWIHTLLYENDIVLRDFNIKEESKDMLYFIKS